MKENRRSVPARSAPKDLDTLLNSSLEDLKIHFPLPPRRQHPASAARKTSLAAIGACLLATFSLWLIDPVYQQENYATSPTSRQQIQLADGTRLDLDAGSHLTIRWGLRTRQAELHSGRVLFSVSPAWLRPFEVSADGVHIRVLGTQFNVRRQAERVAVNVAEGKVAVHDGGSVLHLTAGQRVTRQGGQLGAIETIAPEAVRDWRDGRIHLERTSLAEALAEFQPWLRQEARAVGTAQQLTVSGVFDSARADDFLDLLPEILPVIVVKAADGAQEIHKK